jgi:N-acyl-D-amino-acid deacylase
MRGSLEMSYDLLIKNGTIVDGTGAKRRKADLAVNDGKIVAIGEITEAAKKVIDVSGLIVAPGFVDPHTHYDAQICWDPLVTPSSSHGVTTVIMGNCGVGIAPCAPDARDTATWDLVNVECIPFEVLKKGITWEWVSFPEFMDAAAKRGSAVNLGFLAPLSPFRHFVMGEASIERAATPEETQQIKVLLKEAVDAGALGFSSSILPNHIGYKGLPLASRLASREEITAYANGLRELGRGVIQFVLTKSIGMLDDEEYQLIDLLLTESDRPVSWGAVVKRYDKPGSYKDAMQKAAPLIARGAKPQVASFRIESELNLRSPGDFGPFPFWSGAFNQDVDTQKKLYSSPEFRQQFRNGLVSPPPGTVFFGYWDLVVIHHVGDPALQSIQGKTIGEVAAERGTDGVDTFLDIAIEDNLQTTFKYPMFDMADDLLTDPGTLISLSDGGAHLTNICDAGYCTELLGSVVRDRKVMSLEFAVKRLTSEPADLFGLKERGRLSVGAAADMVIFDYDTIGSSTLKTIRLNDLPGGAPRLVTEAHGIIYTIVNGSVVFDHGNPSSDLPGQVLRHGVS